MDKFELSTHQNNLIIGSLLGDGWIQRPSGNANCCFRKRQKWISHIKWLNEELKPYSSNFNSVNSSIKRIRLATGKIVSEKIEKRIVGYEMWTRANPVFTNLRTEWYPQGIKQVPESLILNSEILSIWYVDDGTNNKGYRQCSIATDGFSIKDVEFLCSKLNKDLNFCCKPTKHEDNYNIQFHGNNYEKLIYLVKPYIVWEDFIYKINYTELKRRRNFSKSEKQEINFLLGQAVSYVEISKKYNVKVSTLYKMKRNLKYQ